MMQGRGTQRGFTLISALFVLVVVSSLGVYMVSLSTGQQLSSALSVRAAQAMYTAKSGMELMMYRISQGDDCAALPVTVNVEGYTVSLDQCAQANITEGSTIYPVFDLTVSAQIGAFGDPAFVSRQISAVVTGG